MGDTFKIAIDAGDDLWSSVINYFQLFLKTLSLSQTTRPLRYLLFCSLLFPCILIGQDYVDLFKVSYGETLNNTYDGPRSPDTNISFLEADLTLPIVLDENNALITGLAFSKNRVQVFPDEDLEIFRPGFDEDGYANLYSTLLKVGLATTYDDVWSSTIILLPKIASDYVNISGDDFFIGGFALLKMQKTEHLKYRFGIYGSTEAFGFFTTPIVGWYYLSPNTQFEMDMSLPIAADINYTCGMITYGVDYYGIGRSVNINADDSDVYIDVSSLDFSAYIQYNAFGKSVLLRAKAGYASTDFEAYKKGDKIDLGVSAFSFGDDRTQLNPNLSGGVFLKLEAIYRFDLASKEKTGN